MNIPGFIREKFNLHKKEVVEVKVDDKKLKVSRLDSWLPDSLRLGSLVSLDENMFILAQAEGSIIPTPESLTNKVRYISSVAVNENMKLIRAFLTEDMFIQLTMQRNKDLIGWDTVEEHLFQTVFIEYPDDWEPVLGPDGLGQETFTDGGGNEYFRSTGLPDMKYEQPVTAVETGIFDATGENGWITDINYHLYERMLSGSGNEFLLIQVEDVREENGKPGNRACVTYSLGIKLPRNLSFIPTQA